MANAAVSSDWDLITVKARIRAFFGAVDNDRRALRCPSDLGKGWLVPGSLHSVEGPQVLRLRELA
jgi:hypothetical protein